jgi:hypothetical protein
MRHYITPRQTTHFFFVSLFLAFSLAIGVWGYHMFGNLNYIDSLLNASMILTGMRPVDRMETDAGKLFSSFYALYSGVAFLTAVGVLLAPALHVFLKKMNME